MRCCGRPLIGNHDAHGKNFSILYGHTGAGLAPLYDALSTAVYPHLTDTMAMKIGGKYRFTEVMARNWQQSARDGGLSPAQVKQRILEIARRLPGLALDTHRSERASANRFGAFGDKLHAGYADGQSSLHVTPHMGGFARKYVR